MADALISVLLVEDNSVEARLLRGVLVNVRPQCIRLYQVVCLEDALHSLEGNHFDIVLLDLSLPDSRGIETFLHVNSSLSETPVIVLCDGEDETIASKAVQLGAQDYLRKSEVNQSLLLHAIRNAIARHCMQHMLRTMSLLDDLTGLYNHRGFFTLAEQQFKIAQRAKHNIAIVFADLDGLKEVNDDHGHHHGDQMLKKMAEILRTTFRSSDILARLGGDEFAVMIVDASPGAVDVILGRLQQHIDEYNLTNHGRYPLSISLGLVYSDCHHPVTLHDLLTRADALMYVQKRGKRLRVSA